MALRIWRPCSRTRWSFEQADGVIADPLFQSQYLHQIYLRAKPDYTGRVTVPVLWDKQRNTIVSNESSDIIRMFNSAFDAVGARADDFYPEMLRTEIDALNALIYERINNGVYRAGFATSQNAYEEAVRQLFETLEQLEDRLARQRYLLGERIPILGHP